MTDRLVLSNLAMKPNETTNELLTRITWTTRVIRESFDEYDAKTTGTEKVLSFYFYSNISKYQFFLGKLITISNAPFLYY